ncbi:MAG: hypothetical protein ACXVEF_34960 [Polyangiales bacterium]
MSRTHLLGFLSSVVFALPFACSSSGSPAAPNDPVTTSPTTEADAGMQSAPLTYPAGPYGLARGNVFPNLKFKGYHDGKGAWTDIQMSDYYDPDGSRGINAIYMTVSAEWCPVCKEDAKVLPGWYSSHYQPRGARFITSILETVDRTSATKDAVDAWVTAYKPNFDIVADVDEATFPPTFMALPVNFEIDPRTMVVFRAFNNGAQFPKGIPGLDLLLDQNHAPSAPPIVTDDAGTGEDADAGDPADAATDG